MLPDLTRFGKFNPQTPLNPSFPDHMREIGYKSTGGYPIEQAPWMAGPPVPDFMSLGGWNNVPPVSQSYFSTEAGIFRDPKNGYYEIMNNGKGIQKTSQSFPPYFKNINTYKNLGDEPSYYKLGDEPSYYKLGESSKIGLFPLLGFVAVVGVLAYMVPEDKTTEFGGGF